MRSPVSWLTDQEYQALPVGERVLAQARSRVGTKEVGRNRGTWVERFLASVGLGGGHAWCAAFVHWCIVRSGAPPKALPRFSGRVRSWVYWAARNGRWRTAPRRGYLAYWVNANGTGHIGIVAEVMPDGKVRTIEGNTDDGGSREGDGVYERVRPVATWNGYIDVDGLA